MDTVTYIDAGCRWVEFLSRYGFLRGHDGLDREGWEQVRFSELPFHSGSPGTAKREYVEYVENGCKGTKHNFLLLVLSIRATWMDYVFVHGKWMT